MLYNTHIVFTGGNECVVRHCLNFLFIIDTSEIYFFISFKLHVCICVLCCDFANNSHFRIYFLQVLYIKQIFYFYKKNRQLYFLCIFYLLSVFIYL